jgi:catechol 2,3-dioxygenase-like lactoylglutathione lyase family enzyme
MAAPDPVTSNLANSFIPETRQICIVTRDLDAMVRRYADALGIGPWWVNEYSAPDLFDTTYRGQPATYSMRLALAWTGALNWEIIQPLDGPSIYKDFLERNEEGVQHVGIMLGDLGMTWEECHASFKARGNPPYMVAVSLPLSIDPAAHHSTPERRPEISAPRPLRFALVQKG